MKHPEYRHLSKFKPKTFSSLKKPHVSVKAPGISPYVENRDFTDQIIILQDELNAVQTADPSTFGRFERDSIHRIKFNKIHAKAEIIRLNRIARDNWLAHAEENQG